MTIEPLPPAVEANLKSYVEWNTLTRHQLIVAHMELARGMREETNRLADALGQTTTAGLHALVTEALSHIDKKWDAKNKRPIDETQD